MAKFFVAPLPNFLSGYANAQSPVQYVRWLLPPGVKRPLHETDH